MKRSNPKAKQILSEPAILSRIDKVRERLAGTDRQGDLAELIEWERKAKSALILLNLKGHEGIKMVLTKAVEEIRFRKARLETRPESLSPEASMKYATERSFDFSVIDLYTWFIGLFSEAEQAIREIELDLENNETEQENDPYVGDSPVIPPLSTGDGE